MLLQILILLDRTGGSSRKCLQVLWKIYGLWKVLPTTYKLSRNVSPIGELASAFDGFCDAYEVLGSVPLPNNPGRLSNQFRTGADRCTPTLPR